ncbi:hypothetical protein chiPu_0020072 [Chiloscyllium punctatum]|uniref:Uncharacterized protein n=1 Tax=Chiloscyllium punctatum TaxID=137246 RepID=A0A401RTX7_CHIPU|nr:hypothetical protein [Chiloscyllium punctatum]
MRTPARQGYGQSSACVQPSGPCVQVPRVRAAVRAVRAGTPRACNRQSRVCRYPACVPPSGPCAQVPRVRAAVRAARAISPRACSLSACVQPSGPCAGHLRQFLIDLQPPSPPCGCSRSCNSSSFVLLLEFLTGEISHF